MLDKQRLCAAPGCYRTTNEDGRYCTEHVQQPDWPALPKRSWGIRSNDSLYRSAQWRKLAKEIISEQRACARCGAKESLHVHHIIAPRGDESLFFDRSNLVVLCQWCHALVTEAEIADRKRDRNTLQKKKVWKK